MIFKDNIGFVPTILHLIWFAMYRCSSGLYCNSKFLIDGEDRGYQLGMVQNCYGLEPFCVIIEEFFTPNNHSVWFQGCAYRAGMFYSLGDSLCGENRVAICASQRRYALCNPNEGFYTVKDNTTVRFCLCNRWNWCNTERLLANESFYTYSDSTYPTYDYSTISTYFTARASPQLNNLGKNGLYFMTLLIGLFALANEE